MKNSQFFKELFRKEKDPIDDIIGHAEVKAQIKSALLVERNICIFGPPGIGKTTMAKNIARLLAQITVNDCDYNCLPQNPICPRCRQHKTAGTKMISGKERFVRVQGSPDLTAEDLLGDIDPIKAMEYGPLSIEAFSPGKIFKANNGILFFDELNRCPEKLQNALLQVLEEKRATIGSYDVDIEADFIFIATMNPKDINTERLSDVLLDRFDVIYMSYPQTDDDEKKIMQLKGKDIASFPPALKDLVVSYVRNLRQDKSLEKVPSVRATIGLYDRAQSNAVLRGRDTVDFDDIRDAIESVIAHRIRLRPSVKYLEDVNRYLMKDFEKFVEDNFSDVDSLSPAGGQKGGGR